MLYTPNPPQSSAAVSAAVVEASRPHQWAIATDRTLLALVLLPAFTPAIAQQRVRTATNESTYAELNKAPRKAAARPNPLATDSDAIPAGAKLFALHCAECHGEDAAGGKKAPSLRAPEVQQATSGAIFWLLTNGVVRRGMPVWSKFPEPQRWQLVSYIKSLNPSLADSEKTSP